MIQYQAVLSHNLGKKTCGKEDWGERGSCMTQPHDVAMGSERNERGTGGADFPLLHGISQHFVL
jgi:hypothetical protein